jgi:hypothetical protein
MEKRKLIYIMGGARCGTTLLEIILGNAEGVFSGGELNRYPKYHGVPHNVETDAPRYQFWGKVKQEVDEKFDYAELRILHEEFEYHTGLLKRKVGIFDQKRYQGYLEFIAFLFDRIFFHSQCQIISDSSKYPGRALNLPKALDIEIVYIYLKRNPINVVNSFAKRDVEQPPKNWLMANLYNVTVHSLCKDAARQLKKGHKLVEVDYSDLTNKPVDVIKNMQDKLDLDLSNILSKLNDQTEFKVGNLFDGNRIRLKDKLRLRKSKELEELKLKDHLTKIINAPVFP